MPIETDETESRKGLGGRLKSFVMRCWAFLPFGYLCRFWYGNGQRITLLKTGWLVIDSGPKTCTDMLSITMVSQNLVDEIEKQMRMRGYA